MWVGGVADSQRRSNPLNPPHKKNKKEITPKFAFFIPEFHLLSFSQISQKPLGGWVVSHIWGNFPPKKLFFTFPRKNKPNFIFVIKK